MPSRASVFAGVSGQKEELRCERDAAGRGPPPPGAGEEAQARGRPPLPALDLSLERPDPGRHRGHKGLFPKLWNPEWWMAQLRLGLGPLALRESLLPTPTPSARLPSPFPAPLLQHALLSC